MGFFSKTDQQIFALLFVNRIACYKDFYRVVSKTGDGLLYLVLALAILIMDTVSGESFFFIALTAYAIERPLYLVLKNTIRRERPYETLRQFAAQVSPSDKFSLPSGHTAGAFVMATLLDSFYPGLALIAYSWAIVIGFSRIALGVHYPGDIIAGALLGVSSAHLGMYIYPLI
jgi:undecaprenyl-diphosphatase